MEQIYDRGHIPILVGGTGFYIQAVLRGIDFTENEENTEYREKMEQLAKEKGPEVLHDMRRDGFSGQFIIFQCTDGSLDIVCMNVLC